MTIALMRPDVSLRMKTRRTPEMTKQTLTYSALRGGAFRGARGSRAGIACTARGKAIKGIRRRFTQFDHRKFPIDRGLSLVVTLVLVSPNYKFN